MKKYWLILLLFFITGNISADMLAVRGEIIFNESNVRNNVYNYIVSKSSTLAFVQEQKIVSYDNLATTGTIAMYGIQVYIRFPLDRINNRNEIINKIKTFVSNNQSKIVSKWCRIHKCDHDLSADKRTGCKEVDIQW